MVGIIDTTSKKLKKESTPAMGTSGEAHSRQREHHMQRPGVEMLLAFLRTSEKISTDINKGENSGNETRGIMTSHTM